MAPTLLPSFRPPESATPRQRGDLERQIFKHGSPGDLSQFRSPAANHNTGKSIQFNSFHDNNFVHVPMLQDNSVDLVSPVHLGSLSPAQQEVDSLETLGRLGDLLTRLWEMAAVQGAAENVWVQLWETMQLLRSQLLSSHHVVLGVSGDMSHSMSHPTSHSLSTPHPTPAGTHRPPEKEHSVSGANASASSAGKTAPSLLPSTTQSPPEQEADPTVPSLEVFVRGRGFKSVRLRLHLTDSIISIKQRIQSLRGVPVHHQRLIYDGRIMEPTMRISDFNVYQLCSFHLVSTWSAPAAASHAFRLRDLSPGSGANDSRSRGDVGGVRSSEGVSGGWDRSPLLPPPPTIREGSGLSEEDMMLRSILGISIQGLGSEEDVALTLSPPPTVTWMPTHQTTTTTAHAEL